MEQRMDIARVAPEPYRVMMLFDRYLGETETDPSLITLVRLRMAELDGCAYTKEIWARNFGARGGDEGQIRELSRWQDSDRFSARERAALGWTEVLAREGKGPSGEAFEAVRQHFSERELVDLTYAVELAHAWNRIILALGPPSKQAPSPGREAPPSEPERQITYTTDELDVTH